MVTPRRVGLNCGAVFVLIIVIIFYFFKEEVSRAKKQLQSMLMMNLESRIVMFEDIGRLDHPACKPFTCFTVYLFMIGFNFRILSWL